MPAATQKKASKPKTKTAAARKTAKTKPVAEETQQELIAEEVEVSPALPPAPVAKLKKTERPSSNAIRPIREQFDLNLIVLAGRVRSVWGNKTDVFARLSVSHRGRLIEDDDALSSYVTLRIADGMVAGTPISIQPGEALRVQGYLTHREYSETLRKFLDDAHSINFLDLVDPSDLPSWRSLSFKRQNAVMNVLSMSLLDQDCQTLAHFGEAAQQEDRVLNRANVEGIVARVWEYRHNEGVDIFTRLAVYDEHTPLDAKRDGNYGRPRRLAHYVTVRFPCGKTSSGFPVRLSPGARVRVSGELRDKGQAVTLREELLRTGMPAVAEMMGRVSNAERMSEIKNTQESLHILADAVIVYSASGGSRNK